MDPNDPVDAIALAWTRERPGTPTDAIGVVTRIWHLAKTFGDDRRRVLAAEGVDAATLDLLSVLRRALAHPQGFGGMSLRVSEEALEAIAAEGLVFDALILSHQISAITEVAKRHPGLSIVLDHAAKPQFGDPGAMARWLLGIEKLAALPNVTCKVSGLLTELGSGGSRADVARAIGVLFDLFGPERLLWGSDWPVLTLVGGYQGWFDLAREVIAAKDSSAVDAVMGGNARRIYRPAR